MNDHGTTQDLITDSSVNDHGTTHAASCASLRSGADRDRDQLQTGRNRYDSQHSLSAHCLPENSCERCRSLESQLDQARQALTELRSQFAVDLEQMQSDMVLKNRQLTRMKAELAKHREEDEDASEVKDILLYAKAQWGKRKNWAIDVESDRWKLTAKTLKRPAYDKQILLTCIDQLAQNPWCGNRGYQPAPYPGATKRLDIDYAYGTDQRVSMWLERASGERNPIAEPSQPVAAPVTQLHSYRPRLPQQPKLQREGIDELLNALTASGQAWRPSGPDQWMAQCPVHEDRSPSLSIKRTETRRVLLHCHAGCDDGEIVNTLGVSWRDLLGDEARAAA